MVGALAVLVIVLVLLAGASAGPWEWPDRTGGSTFTADEDVTPFFPTMPSMEGTPVPEEAEESFGESPWVRWLLIGFAAAVGVLILMLLLRLALMLRRDKLPPPDPREVGTPGSDEFIDAPAIQEGIEAAQQALASERPPRDAIVQAWLALERAAEHAGAARRPSQTPTEFVAVVLARTEADDDAVDTLRRLYTASRFSEAEITRRDAEGARDALRRVAASWSALEVPR